MWSGQSRNLNLRPLSTWTKASLRLHYTSAREALSVTSSDLCLFCSYDAAEDNELSFREGDRIIEIEAVSDDWWSGRDRHGSVGLFPGARFALPV
jgi:hypothetical protein